MSQQFKLKAPTSLSSLKNGDKVESEVEGIEGGKVLLVKVNNEIHALNANCTHYGAPLKNGVLTQDGRLTCPWHGACFSVKSGDIEDAPAFDALNKFDVIEKDGAVYVAGEQSAIKNGRRAPAITCKATGQEHVLVVGGGSGGFGTVQALRENGYDGSLTVISNEPSLPVDRTKLSKALISDPNKILLRPKEWYDTAAIDIVSDEVNSVDFSKKTVATTSGKSLQYTKLVLATGGIPKQLPLPGFQVLENIFVLRHVANVSDLVAAVGDKNKKIVVVGSSFIGMEAGNALANGNDVTIVGMEKAPLERVMGEQVGRVFQANLEKAGVKFKMNAGVDKATPSTSDASKVGAVHLKDGTVLPADIVLLGVGVGPATGFLRNNSAIQLEKDGSIKTDGNFAVPGVSDVYAIGDIATYPYKGPGTDAGTGTYTRIEHWNVAQNQGRSVARVIASKGSVSVQAQVFIPVFWSALGAQLRYCGNTPKGWDGLVLRGEPENGKFAAFYTLGDTVVAVASMGMDPVMTKSSELMKAGKMPGKKELESGADVLELAL